jgi:hypothetical protein
MTIAEVAKCRITRNGWRVERQDDDGGIEVTVFYGNNPQERAESFAQLLNF